MPRIQFTVHGNVQGVGFRMTTRRLAQSHVLTGFVRNTARGTVEGEAQHAQQETLDAFVAQLRESPAGQVTKVNVTSLAEQRNETGFNVYGP